MVRLTLSKTEKRMRQISVIGRNPNVSSESPEVVIKNLYMIRKLRPSRKWGKWGRPINIRQLENFLKEKTLLTNGITDEIKYDLSVYASLLQKKKTNYFNSKKY